ncbi:MAG: OsmC family protein [Promethearchaeota archaeon]
MSDEIGMKVKVELEKDMIFRWDMGINTEKTFYIDEEHNASELWGPDPSRLLASAVLGCMSASFLFCLKKRNLTLDDLKGEAEIVIAINEKKLSRVKEINVKLTPITSDPKVNKRIEQCKKFFEQYCTVTESVRAGIKVNAEIE